MILVQCISALTATILQTTLSTYCDKNVFGHLIYVPQVNKYQIIKKLFTL